MKGLNSIYSGAEHFTDVLKNHVLVLRVTLLGSLWNHQLIHVVSLYIQNALNTFNYNQ